MRYWKKRGYNQYIRLVHFFSAPDSRERFSGERMKCPSCGFDNPPASFCGQCGNKLAAAEDQLTSVEFDQLRLYLPSTLIDEWQFDLAAPPPNLLKQSADHLYRLVDTTTTYLPAHIVDRILRDPVPGQIDGRFVDGSLMFTDISGFTPMSERLSRIGREGAEEIPALQSLLQRDAGDSA
jgi:hypothetical protein